MISRAQHVLTANSAAKIYTMSNKGLFKVSIEAYDRMREYIQDNDVKAEAGGVMLGRFIIDSKNIVVDRVTVPLLGDKRDRYKFFRSAKPHQRVIDNAWEKTNGRVNYLGEWHTHPENYPSPSRIDYEAWEKKLKHDVFSSRYLYFIIMGIKEMRVWEGDRRTLKFKQLNLK